MQAQRAVTNMTNELLKKNAETLKMSTIETAKESERGIIDIETLVQTNQSLIDTINEELLKSCELTGIWEKKLRDIEHKKYEAADFINELKQQVTEIVYDVLRDNSNRRVTITTDEDLKKAKKKKTAAPKKAAAKSAATSSTASTKNAAASPQPATSEPSADDSIIGTTCPVCGKGTIIKGKTAYGCSNWKNGCTYRVAFK